MDKFNNITIEIKTSDSLDRRQILNVLSAWVERIFPEMRNIKENEVDILNQTIHGTVSDMNIKLEHF